MYFKFSPKELLDMLDPETKAQFKKELEQGLLESMRSDHIQNEIQKKIDRGIENTTQHVFKMHKDFRGNYTPMGEAAKALDKALAGMLTQHTLHDFLDKQIEFHVKEALPEILDAYVSSPQFVKQQLTPLLENWNDERIQKIVNREISNYFAKLIGKQEGAQ